MSTEERLTALEINVGHINQTLIDMRHFLAEMSTDNKRQFEKIDARFDTLENKFDKKIDILDDKFDRKFDVLGNRIWSNFIWTVGIAIGLAGLVAHAQHWI